MLLCAGIVRLSQRGLCSNRVQLEDCWGVSLMCADALRLLHCSQCCRDVSYVEWRIPSLSSVRILWLSAGQHVSHLCRRSGVSETTPTVHEQHATVSSRHMSPMVAIYNSVRSLIYVCWRLAATSAQLLFQGGHPGGASDTHPPVSGHPAVFLEHSESQMCGCGGMLMIYPAVCLCLAAITPPPVLPTCCRNRVADT